MIFVFDHINLKEVVRRFPDAKTRIVRLGDFLPNGREEISDPFGQPRESFDQCYRLIADSLSKD